MNPLSGKGYGILKRLPHYYSPTEAGDFLLRVVDLFGHRLEHAELDLYQVLRAHHIETADNQGFQGYTAAPNKRGDLDKIFALYLEVLGGTSQLVKINPNFTVRSFNARRLARSLTIQQNPLIDFLHKVFDAATWDLVVRYRLENALFVTAEIKPDFARELVLRRLPAARLVRSRLSAHTEMLLEAYGGGDNLDARLVSALVNDLNSRVLRDGRLFEENPGYFRSLPLSDAAWALLNSIEQAFLQSLYISEAAAAAGTSQSNPDLLAQRLAALDRSERAEVPVGDDQTRLNRMLLEAAFPLDTSHTWGFSARQIPTLNEIRLALQNEFNRLLQLPDLYLPERFPDLAEGYANLAVRYQDQPVWIKRQLLESAFPDEIEKSYAAYRERLRGLISVLRSGAATRQGILDIVAANLGIVGDDEQARSARGQISIQEYNPQRTDFFNGPVTFFQEFTLTNNNLFAQTPEIWITMLDYPVKGLANVRIVDIATGQSVEVASILQPKDRIIFSAGGVTLNGVTPPQGVVGKVPVVPPQDSKWRFEADILAEDGKIKPIGRYDLPAGEFDTSVFTSDDAVVNIEVVSYQFTPGIFKVIIPWNIPGFTDKYEETQDHPRHMILALVNRVKAAGVLAQIAYRQAFQETQEHSAALTLQIHGTLLDQTQDMEENFAIDSRQTAKEDQDVQDALVISGRFDYTSFDSLNGFE